MDSIEYNLVSLLASRLEILEKASNLQESSLSLDESVAEAKKLALEEAYGHCTLLTDPDDGSDPISLETLSTIKTAFGFVIANGYHADDVMTEQ